MKSLQLFLLLFILFFSAGQAQDVIVKNNGKRILCTILDESDQVIRYRKYNEPNGPIYKVSRDKVFSVEYEQQEDSLINPASVGQIGQGPELLSIGNGFWGLTIRRGERRLSSMDIRALFSDQPEALSAFKRGKTINAFASIIGLPSAFLLGYGLGTLMGGGEVNGVVMAASGVGTAVGILMNVAGNSNIRRSVQLYNDKLTHNNGLSIKLGLSAQGIGLGVWF